MRPPRTIVVTIFAVLLLAAPVVMSSSGAPAQQQPTFRSGVEVVAIDVNVVDAHAKPVEGLKPADFTVTVDRKPRTIASVQYVNHGIRLATTKSGARTAVTGSAVLDALAAPAPERAGRNVMIVVDTDSMDVPYGQSAIRAAKGFLDQLPAVDRVGVATIPRLPSTLAFSESRVAARKALDSIITAPEDMPKGEQNVGLQEAYDIEKRDGGVLSQVVARECHCQYTGDAASASAGVAASTDPSSATGTCTSAQVQSCVVPLLGLAHQIALAGHMQAQRSLDALRDLADGLRQVPGPKTVVFVSGGLGIPETSTSFDPLEPALAGGQVTLYTLYVEQSSLGQVRRPLSPSYEWDDDIAAIGVENVTAAAGGTLVRVVGQPEAAFERVATEMSGSYLLGIEVEPGDRDGKPHAVDVKVNRKGVEVRSRRRYVIEVEKPRAKRAESPAQPPLSAAARAARRAERSAPLVPELEAVTPEVMALLSRAGDFVRDYQGWVGTLVCDEQSDQTLSRWKTGQVMIDGRPENKEDWFVDKRRRMTSDYLLVHSGNEPIGWQQFRDPFEVDGSAVRPRSARLAKLFVDSPATAAQQAAKLMTESTRYNLGFGQRNMDVPTFALVLLEPRNRARFHFRKEGEEEIGGTKVARLAFVERGTPTIFVGEGDGNLPLEGTLWIEPELGRVLRTTLRLNMEDTDAEITVAYAPTPDLAGLWVPSDVREVYTSDTQKLEWVSRYVNFRTLTAAAK